MSSNGNAITNWNAAVEEWQEMNQQSEQMKEQLAAALATMLAMAQSGNVQGAFMECQEAVLPEAQGAVSQQMGNLGATLNATGSLQQIVTALENELNGGGKNPITPQDAQNYVQTFEQLYQIVQSAAQGNSNSPISQNTAETLLQGLNSLASAWGASSPGDLNASDITQFNNWQANPTTADSNGQTGQQNIQNVQSAANQLTNGISSLSQSTQASEQFWAGIATQFLNALENVYQAEQQQGQAMVQAQNTN
jgi:hypothetical protein